MEKERRESYMILETKLDILIEDFQKAREVQTKELLELNKRLRQDETNLEVLSNTVTWHTVIGGFLFGVLMTLLYKEFLGGHV